MNKIKINIVNILVIILSAIILTNLIVKGSLNSFSEIMSLVLLGTLFFYVAHLFKKYRGKNDSK